MRNPFIDQVCVFEENPLNISLTPAESPVQEKSLKISSEKKDWSAQQYGTMLGAFYVGYVASMIPGAILAQKFGFYPVITGVAFVNGLTTFAFPMGKFIEINI